MNRIIASILIFLRERFNLSHEQDDCIETIHSIEKGVEFRGINIWTLIFAIFIASVGLNVNSTAVIIGAMLISPLMGPIMGLGLSVGIYDFGLLKRSLKNLVIAVMISVITSAIYFFISPLSEAQSELLARTTPTIYDVIIALFGGMAGIVAGSSKEKGNVIPGVAIATALIPPLCTAGYGIATGKILYFLGAFYLFFINAVMISLATFLIVRFLKFPLKQQVDKAQSDRVKKYIYAIVTVTVLPSIFFAFQIVQQTIFKTNALTFVNKEMTFDQTQILSTSVNYNFRDSNTITVIVTGKHLNDETINQLKSQLANYSLKKTRLVIKQGLESAAKIDLNAVKSGIIEELYRKNDAALASKDKQIKLLENEIRILKSVQFPVKDLASEINAINGKITSFSANQIIYYDISAGKPDTTITVNLKTREALQPDEYKVIRKWLNQRLKYKDVKIIEEN